MKTIFIFLFMVALQASSQTVINYQTWTGASGCNIFSSATSVPATVNGSSSTVSHQSTVGQPTYDGVNHVVTINAADISSTGQFPFLRLRLSNSTGSSTSCYGPQTIDHITSGNQIYSHTINSSSFTDYPYSLGSMANAISYMSIANIPIVDGGLQSILIRKITITEISPSATFTLSPSILTLPCGTTIAQTFTVTKTPDVTNYQWNLGANNGWLYNGSPAPQTISTGATNTLTLTPVCNA